MTSKLWGFLGGRSSKNIKVQSFIKKTQTELWNKKVGVRLGLDPSLKIRQSCSRIFAVFFSRIGPCKVRLLEFQGLKSEELDNFALYA